MRVVAQPVAGDVRIAAFGVIQSSFSTTYTAPIGVQIHMPDYDTLEGIEGYLTDLDGLVRLMQDRHEAGYRRKERLKEFIVLGHWFADTCGNFGKCTLSVDYEPTDLAQRLPKVIEPQRLREMIRGLSTSYTASSDIPYAHLACFECGKGWTIENAHDAIVRKDDRLVPLRPGVSIAEFEKEWDKNKEGLFRFNSDPSVRNPKFIDMTPDPRYKNQVVNEKGWRYHHPPFEQERLTKSYVAEPGDEATLTVFIFEHLRCSRIRIARLGREFFDDVMKRAGFSAYTLNEIPNEYCPCEVCSPWFIAKLPAGDIKIGWRKRVINIDWSNTKQDLQSRFMTEDVTKGPYFIHAWGQEKAIEYLGKLREALA